MGVDPERVNSVYRNSIQNLDRGDNAYHVARITRHFNTGDPTIYYAIATENIIRRPTIAAPHILDEIYTLNIIEDEVYQLARRRVREELIPPRPAEEAREVPERAEIHRAPAVIYNDSQNVHDSNVTLHDVEIFRKIKAKKDRDVPMEELFSRIDRLPPDRQRKVNRVMSSIGTEYNSLGVTERDMLQTVWNRINSPENEGRKDVLIENLIQALEDSVEDGHVVCITGRKARIMSSLLFDTSPEISKPTMTTDFIRAEALNKAKSIADKKLEASPEIKKRYDEGDESEEVMRVIGEIQKEIDTTLRADYASAHIDLNNLIADAKAAVL